MWHKAEVAVDMTHGMCLSWQFGRIICDTWHYFGKWFGATWPSRGLPRGTLLLVWLFKSLWSPPDSTP
jgi:hypothetical protein